METAMQEFIRHCKSLRELVPNQDVMPTEYYITKLLEKERQQIIDAHKASNFYSNLEKTNEALINADAEKYYLETFINS